MKFIFVNLILVLTFIFPTLGCGDNRSSPTPTNGSYTVAPSDTSSPAENHSDSDPSNSLQQITSIIELDDLQEANNFHVTLEDLEISENDYIEYEFESALFTTSDCHEDSDYLRGFSIEIPSSTFTIKLSNLNGFMHANKIKQLTAVVINSHNKVLVQKSYYLNVKEKDFLISELEEPVYLIIYGADDHDPKKCKKLNINNLKVSFYAQSG